jgi:HPt (histidine-containing phosphotransfer) domain-containing protein
MTKPQPPGEDDEDDFFVHAAGDQDGLEDELPDGAQTADVLDEVTVAHLCDALTDEMRAGVLRTFESSLPLLLADIRDAAGRGDSGAVRRAAHELKGSAAPLGAVRLSAACVAVEHSGRAGDATIGPEQVQTLETLALQTVECLRDQLL